MGERAKQLIADLDELVDRIQAAVDSRPLLDQAIEATKAKLAEAKAEVDAEDAAEEVAVAGEADQT